MWWQGSSRTVEPCSADGEEAGGAEMKSSRQIGQVGWLRAVGWKFVFRAMTGGGGEGLMGAVAWTGEVGRLECADPSLSLGSSAEMATGVPEP